MSVIASCRAVAALVFFVGRGFLNAADEGLRAGEGVTDITPSAGTELAGFHRPPGKERRSIAARQPASARALVLEDGARNRFAIVSLDACGVSQEFCRDVKKEITRKTGILAENVRIGATHTHSMPTLRHFRQWGRLPADYRDIVAKRIVEAVEFAQKDLAPAKLFLGKERVTGASHNRTSSEFKTDELFTKDSNDDERWLDTTLHALHFVRDGNSRDLLWYQFSAHPVCYADESTGPDFPGLVATKLKAAQGLSPSFLQGHCGDVNSGSSGRGDPEVVSDAIVAGIRKAINNPRPIEMSEIRQITATFHAPLDIELHGRQLAEYRADPSKCTSGPWVDGDFAREWHEWASKWDGAQTSYATPISALRLGDVALLFHPGELYSVYGLELRRDSPFRDTLVIGYADDLIGYLPDPKAYAAGEYSAMVVPKIMSLPCYKPEVGRALRTAGLDLLRKLKSSATELAIQDSQFTIDGRPRFLLGVSYYGALGAPESGVTHDLDEMQRDGFNWLRVWANWAGFGNDVSAVGGDGSQREPHLTRLKDFVRECDTRGMIVDVTLSRGNGVSGPPRLMSEEEHVRAVETLIRALMPYRNWYLDLGNERNIRDSRFVSHGTLKKLRDRAKELDPKRLITASHSSGDDEFIDELEDYLKTTRLDFVSPHRPRSKESSAATEGMTRRYAARMKELGTVVPVHFQEPFRRGYGDWQPQTDDFVRDLRGALAAGAAGWCFHNGDQRKHPDQIPRRSFDLRERRLYDQFDDIEKAVAKRVKAVVREAEPDGR
jgi:Neutral/alkaline non-lysosomal ceramidase, N-terminal